MKHPSQYQRWHRGWTLFRFSTPVVLLLCMLSGAVAEDLAFDEYEIKAAYLYHFGQFITWPDENGQPEGAPFVLGILGQDPFGDRIDARLEGRTIRGRSVEVRRFSKLDELSPCHILFIPASEDPSLAKIVSLFENAQTLLVGESPQFAQKGGMIGFYIESDAIRFQINAERANAAKLRISSRLLDLATLVEDDSRSSATP